MSCTEKKSRPVYEDLITAIKVANEKARTNTDQDKIRYIKAKEDSYKYKALWEKSLAREISLIHENVELKAQLKKLSKQPVKLKML